MCWIVYLWWAAAEGGGWQWDRIRIIFSTQFAHIIRSIPSPYFIPSSCSPVCLLFHNKSEQQQQQHISGPSCLRDIIILPQLAPQILPQKPPTTSSLLIVPVLCLLTPLQFLSQTFLLLLLWSFSFTVNCQSNRSNKNTTCVRIKDEQTVEL